MTVVLSPNRIRLPWANLMFVCSARLFYEACCQVDGSLGFSQVDWVRVPSKFPPRIQRPFWHLLFNVGMGNTHERGLLAAANDRSEKSWSFTRLWWDCIFDFLAEAAESQSLQFCKKIQCPGDRFPENRQNC